jgi:hypothetical protein
VPYKFNPLSGNLDYYKTTSTSGFVPYTGGTANLDLTGYGGTFGSAVTPGTYLTVKSGSRTMTVGDFTFGDSYQGISFADTPSSTNYALLSSGTNTYLNAASAGNIFHRINNVTYLTMSTTLLTSVPNIKVNSSNPIIYLENPGANSATSGRLEFRSSGGAEYAYFTFDASANAFRQYYQTTEVYRIASSGQMQWRSGSASAPALSFYGDTNTGMYSISADSLGLAVGGSEMLKVNAYGIGVNGNNPGGNDSYAVSPSFLATAETYGFTVQNATDYVKTRFRAPDYSLAGGIYGDGLINIISGVSFSNGGSGTPDITIQTGNNYSSLHSGNIYITGHTNVDGGNSASINIAAGANYYGPAGELHLAAGDCLYGGYKGGDCYIRAGAFDSTYSGTGGNLYLDSGTDNISVGNAGTVYICSYSSTAVLSFFGAGGSQRVTASIGGASYTNNAGTGVTDTDTWNGYTIGQVVQALQDYGLLT